MKLIFDGYFKYRFSTSNLQPLNMRRKKTVPDDSEEESSSASSDATVLNVNATNRRNQARRQTAKRPRTVNNSNRDTSPQPGPSGLCNNHNSTENSDSDASESESVDSDYAPLIDATHRKKRKSSGRGAKGKKQKAQKSVNGISSNKRAEKGSQRITAKRKSISNSVQINPEDVESLAQKLVYFLLTEDQKKYAIKRKSVKTYVFKDEDCFPKLYNAVLKKADGILQMIYGMELMEIQDQKDSYLIINKLDKELGIHDYVEMSKLKQQQRGLILYLITVIFMNGNVITEDELTKCLKPLGIDLTSKKLHPIFGDVKKYISSELVKQMYLSYELISKDPEKYEIKWGIRAIQEFDKRELLQFSCQITGHKPEDWRIQFKDAEESANPPQANGNS